MHGCCRILHTCAAYTGVSFGVWRSPVARFVRDEEVVGSNPATPTRAVKVTLLYTRHVQRQSNTTMTSLDGGRIVALAVFCWSIAACQPAQEIAPDEGTIVEDVEDALDRGIAAHGGIEKWQSYGMLVYDMHRGEETERHMIDLHKRMTLQIAEDFEIGYDGTEVWITPNKEAFGGSPSFYNGLYFYFFSIPFVLADPGTNREVLGRVIVDSTEYDAVKVSFDAEIGGSPDDYYIAHFDPETHRLQFVLYTATYFSGEPSEAYNALHYEEWQDVGGLTLPGRLQWYEWDDERKQFGDARGGVSFSNVTLEAASPDSTLFVRPEGAEVDSPAP